MANPSKDYSNELLSKETYEVGELDGVCAFTSPQACLDWIATEPDLKDRTHEFDYVAFEGTIVSEAPETAGVVAHVEKKVGDLMTLDEFKSRYVRNQGMAT